MFHVQGRGGSQKAQILIYQYQFTRYIKCDSCTDLHWFPHWVKSQSEELGLDLATKGGTWSAVMFYLFLNPKL